MNKASDVKADDQQKYSLKIFIERLPIMLLSQLFVASVCVSLLAVDAFKTWDAYTARVRETNVLASNLASKPMPSWLVWWSVSKGMERVRPNCSAFKKY